MLTFEVRNVNENDLGKYRCHAWNQYGEDNSIGRLNFESKRNVIFIAKSCLVFVTGLIMLSSKLLKRPIRQVIQTMRKNYSLANDQQRNGIELFVYLIISLLIIYSVLTSYLIDFASELAQSNYNCSDNTNDDDIKLLNNLAEYIFRCGNK